MSIPELSQELKNISEALDGMPASANALMLHTEEFARELKVIGQHLREALDVVNALIPRVEEPSDNIKMGAVLRAVTTYYRVTSAEIRSGRRSVRLAKPRHIAMYLCRILTPRSFPEIALFLGGRDHTTVMHAEAVVTEKMAENASYKTEVESLSERISSGEFK